MPGSLALAASSYPAEKVARYILASGRKNRFYILPGMEARMLLHFKRPLPEGPLKLFSRVYRKGIVGKVFGLDDV